MIYKNHTVKVYGQNCKNAIINKFIYSSFNYCPLVWHFCSCQSSKKIESIQKRCLRLGLNDYEIDYATLLKKNNTPTMKIKRLGIWAIEIFKAINNINPSFMKDICTPERDAKVLKTFLLNITSLQSMVIKLW